MSSELRPHLEKHLTDDQFAECALGATPEPAIAAHLDACQDCRDEVNAVLGSITTFNAETLDWSERQPAKSLRPLVRERKAQPVWAIASWALAGCFTLGAAISVGTHRFEPSAERTHANAEAADSPAQIERDNKLMLAVYEATSSRAASPLEEYGLPAARSAHEVAAKPQ